MPEHTITAKFGLDTKEGKEALDDLRRHAERTGEHLGGLFRTGEPGERRFHSTIAAIIRDLSTAQGGAVGMGNAVAALMTRIGGGLGVGAALTAIGVGFERMVNRGEELRKTTSNITKETIQMGRELGLSSAAEGYTTLAEKALAFHKQARQARDEAKKEAEHPWREMMERSLILAQHPGLIFSPQEIDKRVAQERLKLNEEATKQEKIAREESEKSFEAQKRAAVIAEASYSANERDVATLKLGNEYMQRRAEVEELSKITGHRAELLGSLDKEFKFRQKIIDQQDLQLRVSIAGESRLADIKNSELTAEEKTIALAQERLATAKQQEALATTPEARAKAATAVKEAAGGVAAAKINKLIKGGAEEQMTPAQKQAQYQERMKQYEGLKQAAARQGYNSSLIDAPKWGEEDYDPTRRLEAVMAQEAGGVTATETLYNKATGQPAGYASYNAMGERSEHLTGGGGATPGVDFSLTSGTVLRNQLDQGVEQHDAMVAYGLTQRVGTYTDESKIQANQAAFNAYWSNPAVQAGQAAQRAVGAEARAMKGRIRPGVASTAGDYSLQPSINPNVYSTQPSRRLQPPVSPFVYSTTRGVSPESPNNAIFTPGAGVGGQAPDTGATFTPSGATAPSRTIAAPPPQAMPSPTPTPISSGDKIVTPGYSYIDPAGHKVDVAARTRNKSKTPITKDEMDEIMKTYWT